MSHAEDEAPAPDPGHEPNLAELRRTQVLAAAAECFNREGFHGASMADIASGASLSVGQIYRYFDNKEAVIAALVERALEAWTQRMAEAYSRSGDPVDQLLEAARYHSEKMGEGGRAALSLEFLAEAARNPRIAEIVRMIDGAVRAHVRQLLIQGGAKDDAHLASRLDMIAMLIDGWPVRAVKNPASNREEYLAALRPLFEVLVHCRGAQCA